MLVSAAAWSGPVFITVRSEPVMTPENATGEESKSNRNPSKERLSVIMGIRDYYGDRSRTRECAWPTEIRARQARVRVNATRIGSLRTKVERKFDAATSMLSARRWRPLILRRVNQGAAAPAGEPFPTRLNKIRSTVIPTDVGHSFRTRFGFD